MDWLSRDDLPTRSNTNAGPTLHTPDAQCIGRHTFRYAVMPFAGDPFAADLKGESDRYRVPPPSPTRAWPTACVPGGESLVRKTDPRVAITAIKKAEKGDQLVVRMYNQADDQVTETLHFDMPVLDAEKVDLLEGPLEMDRAEPAVTHGGMRLQVPLAPCEIATVAIAFESRDPGGVTMTSRREFLVGAGAGLASLGTAYMARAQDGPPNNPNAMNLIDKIVPPGGSPAAGPWSSAPGATACRPTRRPGKS